MIWAGAERRPRIDLGHWKRGQSKIYQRHLVQKGQNSHFGLSS